VAESRSVEEGDRRRGHCRGPENGTDQRETQETTQASNGHPIATPNMEHPLRLDGHTHLRTKGSSPHPPQKH